SAVFRKSIGQRIAYEVRSHLQAVLPDHPIQSVSKGGQVGIQQTVRVAVAVVEGGETTAEIDRRMAQGCQQILADHVSVSVNVGLVKSNPRKESFQTSVAVPVDVLAIKSAARFIHNVVREGASVRKCDCVVSPIVLLQPKSGVGALHQA